MAGAVSQKSQFESLRDVASLINSGGDLRSVLRDLILIACRYGKWTLGSIMAIDVAQGFAEVVVRHDPTLLSQTLQDRWDLATSPTLVALQRNAPVYIRDVHKSKEFPGFRKEGVERNYHTVVVVPMRCNDLENRPMVLNVISREIVDVSEDDLAFLGMLVHLGAMAVEKARRVQEDRMHTERMERALQAQASLLDQVLSDSSIRAVVERISLLLPNPMVLVDFLGGTAVANRSPDPASYEDGSWDAAVRGSLRPDLEAAARSAIEQPHSGLRDVFLGEGAQRFRAAVRIETLHVDKEPVGALIVFPVGGAFGDLDLLLLDSAKFALSVQMMRNAIRLRSESRSLTTLFLEIVGQHRRDPADLAARAQALGIDPAAPAQMIFVDFPRAAKKQSHRLAELQRDVERLARKSQRRAVTVAIDDGVICHVAVEPGKGRDRAQKLMQRLAAEIERACGEAPIVVLSGVCGSFQDYPAEWERCWRMIRLSQAFNRRGVLAERDFGPLPMLMAAAKSDDVRDFVETSIGAIVRHDRAQGTQYLDTLTRYLEQGCRSQACADAMGLHVTTLRYRLTRIEELFQVNVDGPEQRFALELAIRLNDVIDGRA